MIASPDPTRETLIAVVDDDARVCRAVARALSGGGYRTRTFESARTYLAMRPGLSHACLLADIRMPEMDGLELQRRSSHDGSGIPTIFMTATGDVETIASAFRAGACDVLAKPFTPEELLRAVGRAVATWRDTRAREASLARLWRDAHTLTPREADVATLVVRGLINKRVAALLRVSERTVKIHRGRAMQKLGAASLADLVRTVDELLDEQADRITLGNESVSRPQIIERMRAASQLAPRDVPPD